MLLYKSRLISEVGTITLSPICWELQNTIRKIKPYINIETKLKSLSVSLCEKNTLCVLCALCGKIHHRGRNFNNHEITALGAKDRRGILVFYFPLRTFAPFAVKHFKSFRNYYESK